MCRLQQILSAGIGRGHVRAAVASGQLVQVRKGLYAVPGADRLFAEARRTRSLVTCVSAAPLRGLAVLRYGYSDVVHRPELLTDEVARLVAAGRARGGVDSDRLSPRAGSQRP